jgi:very-short-patch-repair endonuclease
MTKSRNKKTPHSLVPLARELRHDDTRAEKIAWTLLKDRRLDGYKFRRQVPIENFIVDFCCHELKLIIELDGDIHAETFQWEKDQKRDARLKELGFTVLRFSNEVFFRRLGFLRREDSLTPALTRRCAPPSPGGRGLTPTPYSALPTRPALYNRSSMYIRRVE